MINANTGSVAQIMEHDTYGVVTQDTNAGLTPFGFAGGLYTQQSGLVRFGARDYDPEAGRWTAKDPIRFSGGDENLYGYVLQDPVNRNDPPGTGPVAGGICVSADVALTAVLGLPEILSLTMQIEAHQDGINNINYRLKNLPKTCDEYHPDRINLLLELKKQTTAQNKLIVQKSDQIAKIMMASVGGGGSICGALYKLPIP